MSTTKTKEEYIKYKQSKFKRHGFAQNLTNICIYFLATKKKRHNVEIGIKLQDVDLVPEASKGGQGLYRTGVEIKMPN